MIKATIVGSNTTEIVALINLGDMILLINAIEFIPYLEYNIRACGGMDMEYLTSNEIAVKWDISSRRVRKLCGEGRVEGAIQKGNLWLIPENSMKPEEFQRGRKKQDDVMK